MQDARYLGLRYIRSNLWTMSTVMEIMGMHQYTHVILFATRSRDSASQFHISKQAEEFVRALVFLVSCILERVQLPAIEC
jgi:hypothetical protein